MDELIVLDAVVSMLDGLTVDGLTAEVFRYPDADTKPIFVDLPVIIVTKGRSLQNTFVTKGIGRFQYRWHISIGVYLGLRDIPNAQVEQQIAGWSHAVTKTLIADRTLQNTVSGCGEGEIFIYSADGHLHWYDEESRDATSYYGAHLTLPVYQNDVF